ncbi:MAG: RraA family protein [Candidatus Heteroscillospira sp.]|jgi:4-hydroxy-4-methyl-2-oxoglutarate aldolase
MITKEQLEAIRQYDVPTVCNALECFNLQSRTDGYISGEDIKEIVGVQGGRMIGFAATAKYSTANAMKKGYVNHDAEYYQHVKDTQEPTIAVQQDVDKHMVSAIWGDVNLHIHKLLGCVGTLTNGGVRDNDAARENNFGYYAPCSNPSHGYYHLVDYACPVEIFGITIYPGDLIMCDEHGAVIIPEKVVPYLPEACKAMTEAEYPVLKPADEALREGRDVSVAEIVAWKKEMAEKRKAYVPPVID